MHWDSQRKAQYLRYNGKNCQHNDMYYFSFFSFKYGIMWLYSKIPYQHIPSPNDKGLDHWFLKPTWCCHKNHRIFPVLFCVNNPSQFYTLDLCASHEKCPPCRIQFIVFPKSIDIAWTHKSIELNQFQSVLIGFFGNVQVVLVSKFLEELLCL